MNENNVPMMLPNGQVFGQRVSDNSEETTTCSEGRSPEGRPTNSEDRSRPASPDRPVLNPRQFNRVDRRRNYRRVNYRSLNAPRDVIRRIVMEVDSDFEESDLDYMDLVEIDDE